MQLNYWDGNKSQNEGKDHHSIDEQTNIKSLLGQKHLQVPTHDHQFKCCKILQCSSSSRLDQLSSTNIEYMGDGGDKILAKEKLHEGHILIWKKKFNCEQEAT
jgi:hypothetical protein